MHYAISRFVRSKKLHVSVFTKLYKTNKPSFIGKTVCFALVIVFRLQMHSVFRPQTSAFDSALFSFRPETDSTQVCGCKYFYQHKRNVSERNSHVAERAITHLIFHRRSKLFSVNLWDCRFISCFREILTITKCSKK